MKKQEAAQVWSDWRLEQIIGNLLRVGVTAASAVVAFGAVIYLARHGAQAPQYDVFHGEPQSYCTVGGVWRETLDWHGRGLILLGLLLLIATPVARVAFSLVGFALQRDWLYVAITTVVLAVLLYALIGHACV